MFLSCHQGNLHHYSKTTRALRQVLNISHNRIILFFSPQNPQPSYLELEGNGSVLMDDTSSQSSVTVDSEEERKSALEKSMYVWSL